MSNERDKRGHGLDGLVHESEGKTRGKECVGRFDAIYCRRGIREFENQKTKERSNQRLVLAGTVKFGLLGLRIQMRR
jgi:hypothetical protein